MGFSATGGGTLVRLTCNDGDLGVVGSSVMVMLKSCSWFVVVDVSFHIGIGFESLELRSGLTLSGSDSLSVLRSGFGDRVKLLCSENDKSDVSLIGFCFNFDCGGSGIELESCWGAEIAIFLTLS